MKYLYLIIFLFSQLALGATELENESVLLKYTCLDESKNIERIIYSFLPEEEACDRFFKFETALKVSCIDHLNPEKCEIELLHELDALFQPPEKQN